MKNEKGITLVSLIIMIIIILTISTIAIKTSTNSIDLAKYTAFQTELRVIQTKVNEICANEIKENDNIITKPNIGTNASTNPTLKVQEVNKILQEKANKSEKNITQIEQGFNLWTKTDINQTLKIENITQDFLVNIEECIVISVKPFNYEGKDYYMLEQMEDSVYNVTYNNQVVPGEINLTTRINPANKKNQIKVQILNSKYISKWEILWKKKGTSNWWKTNKFEIDVDGEGIYEVQAKNGDKIKLVSEIEIKNIPGKPLENGIFTETSTIDGKPATSNNPIIPEGFKPIDTETSKWKENSNPKPTADAIKNGLVIQDENNAEFVWVPVPDINTMVGASNGPKEERWGKLYSQTNIGNAENNTDKAKPTSGHREPDILTDRTYGDGKQENLDIINKILGTTTYKTDSFLDTLQQEFFEMSESVKKYGGFYIGRYESSFSYGFKGIAPIKGKYVATAERSSANTWYGLYANQKLYKVGEIQGRMIWGCQYDAMLKWLAGNSIDVTSKTPNGASKNTSQRAGTQESDKLCNIYDLLGSSHEWTLEASNADFRVYRGGYYDYSRSPASRVSNSPTNTGSNDSTRATLYIP